MNRRYGKAGKKEVYNTSATFHHENLYKIPTSEQELLSKHPKHKPVVTKPTATAAEKYFSTNIRLHQNPPTNRTMHLKGKAKMSFRKMTVRSAKWKKRDSKRKMITRDVVVTHNGKKLISGATNRKPRVKIDEAIASQPRLFSVRSPGFMEPLQVNVSYNSIETTREIRLPELQSRVPITSFLNIDKRFTEAARRLATIPLELLKAVKYAGLSAHRRSWHFPTNIPDCLATIKNFIIMVPSTPKNLYSRNTIRETWGNVTDLTAIQSQLVFVLGLTKDKMVQQSIVEESNRYNDVVQLDIHDGYYNLSVKTLGILTWVKDHCSSPKYIAKIDEDNLVYLGRILTALNRFYTTDYKFIAGSYRPIKQPDQGGKWANPVYILVYMVVQLTSCPTISLINYLQCVTVCLFCI